MNQLNLIILIYFLFKLNLARVTFRDYGFFRLIYQVRSSLITMLNPMNLWLKFLKLSLLFLGRINKFSYLKLELKLRIAHHKCELVHTTDPT